MQFWEFEFSKTETLGKIDIKLTFQMSPQKMLQFTNVKGLDKTQILPSI